MKALWVSTVWPTPLDTGGRIRSFQTLEALTRVVDKVTVLGLADPAVDAADLRAMLPQARIVDPVPWDIRIRRRPGLLARTAAVALRTGQPYRTAKFDSSALADLVAQHLPGHDVLYVGYIGTMGVIRRLQQRGVVLPPMIVETQNVEYVATLESAAMLRGKQRVAMPLIHEEARRLRRLERDAVRDAAATLAISEPDAERLRELAPGRVIMAPPAATPIVRRAAAGSDVVVIGNLTWPPTVAGLLDILPALRRLGAPEQGERRVVIGAGATAQLRQAIEDAGFEYLGYVDDIEPHWRAARVVVIPGGGTGARMRFLEAFRHGVPIVATADAAAGLDVGEAASIVTTPDGIAPAIEELRGDDVLAAHRGAAGFELAQKRYHPDNVAAAVADALTSVRSPGRNARPATFVG